MEYLLEIPLLAVGVKEDELAEEPLLQCCTAPAAFQAQGIYFRLQFP